MNSLLPFELLVTWDNGVCSTKVLKCGVLISCHRPSFYHHKHFSHGCSICICMWLCSLLANIVYMYHEPCGVIIFLCVRNGSVVVICTRLWLKSQMTKMKVRVGREGIVNIMNHISEDLSGAAQHE